ncbi:hypothetical protein [uncultured Roseobacter sp.]|uniref:lipoyl protein ligase domain-containing protein n=1 Tax=uncultured Roseobacter sp. TaxID=114847 RepID=UPI00262FD969|nr:hypothetical protein [uncultured Roseobacter sp.]
MTTGLRLVQDAAEGLALEAALFATPDLGVLLWSPQRRSIVCPASLIRKHGLQDQGRFAGWPIVARPTGGGAVPQGPGILNLALGYSVPAGTTIEDGYLLLTQYLRAALAEWELKPGHTAASFCDGGWNLSAQGKKVVGTAQRWRPLPDGGFRVLAHALVLVTGDVRGDARVIAALHRSLNLPPVEPDAHETLRGLKGQQEPNMSDIADRLYRVSWAQLQQVDQSRAAA